MNEKNKIQKKSSIPPVNALAFGCFPLLALLSFSVVCLFYETAVYLFSKFLTMAIIGLMDIIESRVM